MNMEYIDKNPTAYLSLAKGDDTPQCSHRSRWFYVVQKNAHLRLVYGLQPLNAPCINDARLPSVLEKFVQRFVAKHFHTIFDLFFGYDTRQSHNINRDMILFISILGLLRCTHIHEGVCDYG
jgi:hypothetical protein